jgi:TIR domain
VTTDTPWYFFSYARSDGDFTLRLAKDLRAAGANVWVDQLDIVGGERWDTAVESALHACKGMILILSPAAVASTNVIDEVSYALDANKIIIPVLCAKCEVPLRLRRVQRVDFTASYEAGVTDLLRAVNLSEPAGQSTRTPRPPNRIVMVVTLVGVVSALGGALFMNRDKLVPPCVVKLAVPENNAVLPQRRLDKEKVETVWLFGWRDCPEASRYHLYVIGPRALNPIVDDDTITAATYQLRRSYYHGVTRQEGWTWKVRAFVDGRWGDWSEERTFNVAAPD